MAYTADNLAYDVIADMSSREIMKGPVWILGKRYMYPKDKEAMNSDIRSRLWCTYRKNFRAISGTALSSDAGWGCTLRCGQMLLAQALITKKLGRDFKWVQGYWDPDYYEILKKFLDVRDSEYSIQMIALQGADFGRQVGQWFGPNNVAQAIKKLAAHDKGSQLAVHVAMDMLVVIDDLKATASEPYGFPQSSINVTNKKGEDIIRSRSMTEGVATSPCFSPKEAGGDVSLSSSYEPESSLYNPNLAEEEGVAYNTPVSTSSPFNKKAPPTVANNNASSTGVSYLDPALRLSLVGGGGGGTSPIVVGDESMDFMKLSLCQHHHMSPASSSLAAERRGYLASPTKVRAVSTPSISQAKRSKFRSLLLFIPLRLGQDTFNIDYQDSLKACLTLPQSVGFIGGRPRHALYFIGYDENNLLFLDPHTNQQTVQVRERESRIPDSSYHCSSYGRMPVSGLDPSIALGFFCKDEDDLDDLVVRLKKFVLKDSCLNMFELTQHRPSYWGPMDPLQASIKEPFLLVSEEEADFEDFEIITWPYNAVTTTTTGHAAVTTTTTTGHAAVSTATGHAAVSTATTTGLADRNRSNSAQPHLKELRSILKTT